MTGGLLIAAALLALGVAVAHSWLGERYLLRRLFRRTDLPKLFGSDHFTRRTLRFAWHVTSVAWIGFAAILAALAAIPAGTDPRRAILGTVAATFLAHAAIAGGASRGRHLSWIVFLGIAVLAWSAAG